MGPGTLRLDLEILRRDKRVETVQLKGRGFSLPCSSRGSIASDRSDTILYNANGEISMSTQENVQIVKNFLAALGRRDKQGLLALSAEDIEWIIPGEDWPLAGTHRGHAGLENLLQKANETVETSYPGITQACGLEVVFQQPARGRPKEKVQQANSFQVPEPKRSSPPLP